MKHTMKEEEAIKRWCPFVRVSSYPFNDENATINRDDFNYNCIASVCMAWRWRMSTKSDHEGEGYCGLAGKP